jgi:hypothetical protein
VTEFLLTLSLPALAATASQVLLPYSQGALLDELRRTGRTYC